MGKRLFALDHNFPEPLVLSLSQYVECAELVPIRQIDKSFSALDDWELIRALHFHERPWDGLITTDDSMLNEVEAVCLLIHTQLSLVVAHGQGHNPIRATGVLLAHIEYVCNHSDPGKKQYWMLRVSTKNPSDPWKRLEKIARHRNETPKNLLQEYSLER